MYPVSWILRGFLAPNTEKNRKNTEKIPKKSTIKNLAVTQINFKLRSTKSLTQIAFHLHEIFNVYFRYFFGFFSVFFRYFFSIFSVFFRYFSGIFPVVIRYVSGSCLVFIRYMFCFLSVNVSLLRKRAQKFRRAF